MLKLKEVVDRQRDELRAKVQEVTTISKEVEAVRTHKHQCEMIVCVTAKLKSHMTPDEAFYRLQVQRSHF